jgi:tetratricopeptide (TPR) repeat protein
MSPRLRDALDWVNGANEEPLRLLRIVAGGLLLFGTVVAVALALSGVAPRALLLVGAFWAIYGLVSGFTNGVLEPCIDGLALALQNAGLTRAGQGYSGIETLAARGHLAEAAEAYRERARLPADRVEATVRRAVLLAGPLGQPETALVELQALREHALGPEQDLQVGIALVDIYERRLGDPGRAMVELRRLIDLYPDRRAVRRLRRELAILRADRWRT